MEHREMVDLIRGGVPASGGAWAELGAGTGNFTWALAELLGPAATIYALDRDARAVAAQERRLRDEPPAATVLPRQADELRPLGPSYARMCCRLALRSRIWPERRSACGPSG